MKPMHIDFLLLIILGFSWRPLFLVITSVFHLICSHISRDDSKTGIKYPYKTLGTEKLF